MNRISPPAISRRLHGRGVRALLAAVLLGLVFGGPLGSEIHAHADSGSHHPLDDWHTDREGGKTAHDEPSSASLHVHAVVAPVVMQDQALPDLALPASSPGWFADDPSVAPSSATYGTPHRPPIA